MGHEEAPPVINIYNETERLVTVRVGDGRCYDAVGDDLTGDWLVSCEEEGDVPVQTWIRSRDGAIQYILERLGVIEDASYVQAPERC